MSAISITSSNETKLWIQDRFAKSSHTLKLFTRLREEYGTLIISANIIKDGTTAFDVLDSIVNFPSFTSFTPGQNSVVIVMDN